MKRKAISTKIRFEVFKRDSFTCQYCGKKAPDVILEIDHITPVKHEGKNDILNLITSCFECNSGKGARELSDTSIITLQRTQIEELQERKNQIEMILEWKMGLTSTTKDEAKKCVDFYNSKWESFHLSENGEKGMRLLVKKYGAIKVIDAINESYMKYADHDREEESFSFVLSKIKSLLRFNSLPLDQQESWRQTSEVLRKCKAKFAGYFDYQAAGIAMNNFLKRGNTIEELKQITEEAQKFSEWKNELYSY